MKTKHEPRTHCPATLQYFNPIHISTHETSSNSSKCEDSIKSEATAVNDEVPRLHREIRSIAYQNHCLEIQLADTQRELQRCLQLLAVKGKSEFHQLTRLPTPNNNDMSDDENEPKQPTIPSVNTSPCQSDVSDLEILTVSPT